MGWLVTSLSEGTRPGFSSGCRGTFSELRAVPYFCVGMSGASGTLVHIFTLLTLPPPWAVFFHLRNQPMNIFRRILNKLLGIQKAPPEPEAPALFPRPVSVSMKMTQTTKPDPMAQAIARAKRDAKKTAVKGSVSSSSSSSTTRPVDPLMDPLNPISPLNPLNQVDDAPARHSVNSHISKGSSWEEASRHHSSPSYDHHHHDSGPSYDSSPSHHDSNW